MKQASRFFSIIILFISILGGCSKSSGGGGGTTTTPTSTVTVSTIAGNGTAGYVDGAATNAEFNAPYGIAIDTLGNIYVGDGGNLRIRKVSNTGSVTTLAGNGVNGYIDGTGSVAQFAPYMDGLGIDKYANIYMANGCGNVSETNANNDRIRQITQAGAVSTFAGNGTTGYKDTARRFAEFFSTSALAFDTQGNLFVTDVYNNRIRKIDTSGKVTTVAGNGVQGFADGAAATAEFAFSGYSGQGHSGIVLDAMGNIYVSDCGNSKIRRITPSGTVNTVAGNGTAGFADGAALNAQFYIPRGITIDKQGNLYVVDGGNMYTRIREISSSGIVNTIAGNGSIGFADGVGTSAEFNNAAAIAIDAKGNLYVADPGNNRIRKITFQ